MPDLVTLQYVQQLADNDSPAGAVIFEKLISSASAAFLTWTNRKAIAPTAFTETISGDGSSLLILRNTPIISIESLAIGGRAQTLFSAASRYGYAMADGDYGVEMIGSCFTAGNRNVSVSYTAGYDPIPADVQEVILQMILWWKNKHPRMDLTSQTLNQVETISYSQADLPGFAKSTIRQYRSLGGFRRR